MKKFYFSLGKWFISAGVVLLPVGAWATNEIQMESYFPTPYVTYNNVFVSQQFDVGTSKGPFTLSLGSNRGNPTPSLQIDPIPFNNNSLQPDGTANAFAHLKTTPKGGPTLSFGNVQMRSQAVRFGSPTDQVDNAEMTFGNLRIATLSNMKAKPVQEINATSVQVDEQMYLMDDRFANLAGAALPGCDKTVSWRKLALGNESDAWYLVCGNPVEGGGTPPGESCPSGRYVWVVDTAYIVCSLKSVDYVSEYCNTIRSGMDLNAIKHILSISDCDTTGMADFFGVKSKALGDTVLEKPTEPGLVYWLYDTQRGINACSDDPADKPATFSWGETINWNAANLVNTGYLQWTAEKGVVRAESFCE